jgi:hypothetical protein
MISYGQFRALTSNIVSIKTKESFLIIFDVFSNYFEYELELFVEHF